MFWNWFTRKQSSPPKETANTRTANDNEAAVSSAVESNAAHPDPAHSDIQPPAPTSTPVQIRSHVSSIDFPSCSTVSSSERSDPVRDIKCEVLANWLHAKQEEKIWTFGQPGEGVFVKKTKRNYACCPTGLTNDGTTLWKAIATLNVRCAMTVSTRIIKIIVSRTELSYVQIQSGQRLQVVPDFDALPHCQRNQSAAFVASHQMLVIWDDDPKALLERAQDIQSSLMNMIWGNDLTYPGEDSRLGSKEHLPEAIEYDGWPYGQYSGEEQPRRLELWQPVYTGVAIFLIICAMGSGWRQIAIQQIQEPNWLRMLFGLAIPGQIWLSLFFFQAILGNLAQIVGPTKLMKTNSKYYSGKAPRRMHHDTHGQLPHVTIQMPVYKEGLHAVIKPTVHSIKRAIATYELQGGTANIFINDDGMQIISPEDASERQEFYDENGIGWVARPKHNPTPDHEKDTFLRRGKFKKASNMNYALRLSVRVEEILATITRPKEWTQQDENKAYEEALQNALRERQGEAWADGIIRVGDYILLIDSDTRVPQDCLLEAVSEMEQSPQVAILQYSSGVMNVTSSFFENGITFFTNMIYTMIRFAVANGDVAPFVGHNAILRWSALQEVSYQCEMDGWEKFWSESTVSEDFDMSLRLQSEGYIVRLGAYKGDGFKEGVSLTVYDELNRWEKYAYGCNELIFHPLKDWIFKGPCTKLFLTFLFSNMPLSSKITIMSYIGTYYAIGSAWFFTILNYFLIGFFNGWLDHYYIESFKVYVAIIFVFTLVGNISLAFCRYRTQEATLFGSLMENLKWIPMLTIFLGGISLHISQALIFHFFSIDMEWGATSKEVEDVSFFEAIKHVGRKFRWTFLFCFTLTAVMLVCRFAIEEDWQIRLLTACWPMGTVIANHFLLPIVLNPQLMTFTW